MSHATPDGVKKVHAALRAAEAQFGRPIGILADLQGPKFRVGNIEGERVSLMTGATFRFDTNEDIGGTERVFLPHPQIFEAVEPGHTLLLDDGKIRMTVTSKNATTVEAQVIVGGMLASRKGISLPDTVLPVGPLTEKDKRDLDFALRLGVDWVALSFVQRGEDEKMARQLIGQAASIMSKIEKPSAITDIDEVIAHSDGLMVARGDLASKCRSRRCRDCRSRSSASRARPASPWSWPRRCWKAWCRRRVPTRAEVSDVATAVFDGADAIMLSAESAVGQFPVEAIRMMDRIAIEVESDPVYNALVHATRTPPLATAADAIAAAHIRSPILQTRGHHLLHGHRLHRAARGARASGPTRYRPVAGGRHGPQARHGVGACTACSPATRRTRRRWCARHAASRWRKLRQAARGHHHRGWRAAGLARHHEHGAHRLHRRAGQPDGRRGVKIPSPRLRRSATGRGR